MLGEILALDSTTLSRTLRPLESEGSIRSRPGEDRRERHWELPEGARWETGSWFGAVLLTRTLVQIHEAEGQEAGARDFLGEAVRAVTGLLGGR